jgi:hypothetical protein
MIPFIIISISRFSESKEGTGWNIIRYAGMQINMFNDYYEINAPNTYGRTNFPVFIKMIESTGIKIKSGPEENERFSYYLEEGVKPWEFATFISSIMVDFGKTGTLVFLMIVSLITRIIIKKVSKNGIFYFSDLIIFIILYQIVYWGIFYFRQYSTNYYIIFNILLFIMFKMFRSKNIVSIYSNRIKQSENIEQPRTYVRGILKGKLRLS